MSQVLGAICPLHNKQVYMWCDTHGFPVCPDCCDIDHDTADFETILEENVETLNKKAETMRLIERAKGSVEEQDRKLERARESMADKKFERDNFQTLSRDPEAFTDNEKRLVREIIDRIRSVELQSGIKIVRKKLDEISNTFDIEQLIDDDVQRMSKFCKISTLDHEYEIERQAFLKQWWTTRLVHVLSTADSVTSLSQEAQLAVIGLGRLLD